VHLQVIFTYLLTNRKTENPVLEVEQQWLKQQWISNKPSLALLQKHLLGDCTINSHIICMIYPYRTAIGGGILIVLLPSR